MKPKNRIRILLAEKEMSAKALGELVGVTQFTVSKWSTNKQQPSLNHIYKISEVLKIGICEILVSPKYNDDKD